MTKKSIIDALHQKRSDYKDPDQAETVSNLLDTVSSDIYSESQRFVFELIQNADDAAKNTNNEVHFEFFNDCLIVAHNGNSFTEEDIKALTSAGSSTKKADTTKTGYKGIGFKSVFGKSTRVTIFSDGFQFRFDKNAFKTTLPWQIIPIWTDLNDLKNEIKESISKNKYAVSTIIEITDVESLQNDLNELLNNGQILLFLRKVSKISVSKNGQLVYLIEKNIVSKDASFTKITLSKDKKEISSWITKTFENIAVPTQTKQELQKDEKTPKKLKDAKYTEMSFAAKIEGEKIKALKEGESLIFTYLPTKVADFKFPFLVNGSFLTNAAREGIHEDKIWNQWLFGLVAEKIIDWLAALSQSQYKFQILHLLPSKFNQQHNGLKKSFDKEFNKYCSQKEFVITTNERISKISEVILDKTGLSNQKFIDPKSITEFLEFEKKINLSDDCFVNTQVEEAYKLKSIGVKTFELENFETFFISKSFTSRHKISENFDLLNYFKEKSDLDKQGIWFQSLKTLPFIYDEAELLCNPSNGICFPIGINSTELGRIPIIHSYIFENIQKDRHIYDWLKSLGVKEPSQTAYVTNVIIPNLKKSDFINDTNFIKITNYLFRLFKENQLDEEMLESLRELKIKTKHKELTFKEAQMCFLSNKYRPQLMIEEIIKDVNFVSEDYLFSGSNELEWHLFFKAIKVKDRVEVETINQNNSLSTLKNITNEAWVNESKEKAEKKGGFGFGSHNVIRSVKLASFLNLVTSNMAYSKIFWKNIVSNSNNLSDLTNDAIFMYGVGNGHNRHTCSVKNYFPWFVKNQNCIPTTTNEILNPENVFINDKEIKEIAGTYLPVFDFDESLTGDWKELLQLKNKLELDDYLTILSKMVKYSEEAEEKDSKLKPSLRRIGLIYQKLAAMISDLTTNDKNKISDWASINKLLSVNGNFEPAIELNWITVEGFSAESGKLKVIQIPENSDKKSKAFEELLLLFNIKKIDEFIPKFDEIRPDDSLKIQLQKIIPYYVALIEKKKLEDRDQEFERIYKLLNAMDFYSVSEIKLSFYLQSETFDGPSLTVYNGENKFYFKGKWKSERTLLSLIKELSNLLGVSGLNEELRFLLLEEDAGEIHEWLVEQGIDLSNVKPVRVFTKRISIEIVKDGQPSPKQLVENIDEFDSDIDVPIKDQSFKPAFSPQSYDITTISARTKTFTDATEKAQINYEKIQSQEIREDVGRWCEEFAYEYLINQKDKFTVVIWVNEKAESGKPYDFEVTENGKKKFIDVKGTPSGIKDLIYLSPNEWIFMFDKGINYSIYRVYNAGNDASIEIIENPSELLKKGKIFPNPITLQV